MTVENNIRKSGPYLYTGSPVFAFDFKVFDNTDVLVVHTDALDTEQVLNLNENYTVQLNGNQEDSPGGTITLKNFSPPEGSKITIASDVPYEQEAVFTNKGGFYPASLNDVADKLTILAQQLREKLTRAVTTPISSDVNPDELLAKLHQDVIDASSSAESARISQAAAKSSEDAALTSKNEAKSSETAAHNSQIAAKGSEDAAEVSADLAQQSADRAGALYGDLEAVSSAAAAASASANAAATSESNAAQSESNAAASAAAASESEQNAAGSEKAAAASAASVSVDEKNLKDAVTSAAASATSAAESAESAAKSAEHATAGQVNADWNATEGPAEIMNKPDTVAGYGITDALQIFGIEEGADPLGVAIKANTIYQFGTVSALTITEVINGFRESQIRFSTGDIIPVVTIPETLKHVGEWEIEPNNDYIVSILDNIAVLGKVVA